MAQPNAQGSSPEAKTSIDALLELLNQKGKLDLVTITTELAVSATLVEEWAKVLETGKLIHVSYEVGKMYLEPLNATAEQIEEGSTKIDTEKAVVQNEIDTEKLAIEKFGKNLDTLSASVGSMDTIFKQKLPNLQSLFNDLDKMYAPAARKAKELEDTRNAADLYFSQIDKRMDTLYSKISTLDSTTTDRMLKLKVDKLSDVLRKADEIKVSLIELEDTKEALYKTVTTEIDQRVKDFKSAFKRSLDDLYIDLKADSAEIMDIEKEVRIEQSDVLKLSQESERMRKEADSARNALISARSSFKDRYQKIIEELNQDSREFQQRYVLATSKLNEIKTSLGDVTRVDDSIKQAKNEIADIQKEVVEAKKAVEQLEDKLKALDAAKNMVTSNKLKTLSEIKKDSADIKAKEEKIKRSINGINQSLSGSDAINEE